MSLQKRVCALFLSLLLCLSVLSTVASAADAPIINYDRYDGVRTDVYEGMWSTYSVKVDNYQAGDTISYKWQFTVKCCEADADRDACAGEWHTSWYDADESCHWLRVYENSPYIEVYNQEGDASVEEGNRYVFRCIVTLNGKEGKSPVFEQHCLPAKKLTEFRVNDVKMPVANSSPDFTGTSATTGISVGAINWTYLAPTGYVSAVGPTDAFAYSGTYQVRVSVKLDDGYCFIKKGDARTEGWLNGSRCLVEYPENNPDYAVLVRTYELTNGTASYVPYLYEIDSLLGYDESHQSPSWNPADTVNHIDVVANTDETFQFAPLQLPDGAVEAGYSVYTSVRWYDGTNWHSGEGTKITSYDGTELTQITINTGAIGESRTVAEELTLMKDGKVVAGKGMNRYFVTNAVEGLPPIITKFFKNDQVKNIGDSLTLYCKASGSDNQYMWQAYHLVVGRYHTDYQWVPLAFGDGNILQYEAVTKEMDGWIFRCRVTNSYGTTYSPEVRLTVNGTIADAVTVTNVPTPAENQTPVWTGASVTSGTGIADSGYICWLRAKDVAGAAAANDVSTFQDCVEVMDTAETFRAGDTYYAMVYVKPTDDYRFIKSRTAVTINGRTAKVIYMESDLLCAAISFKIPGGACPTAGYSDVPPESNWAHAGIDFCVERGIMGSTKTDKLVFEPNTACTRAMIVSILYRLAGSPAVSYQPIFSDVKSGQWYTNAVVWAYLNNVVSGKPDGTFAPNDKITREQMAVTLMGYAKNIAHISTDARTDLSTFADAAKVTWAKDYVSWAVAESIISGKTQNGKTYLDPQGKATRAEVASILMRFINNVLKA